MSKVASRGKATNNDDKYYDLKVSLRLESINGMKEANVLECFAGKGVLWDAVQKKSDIKIKRYKIDVNEFEGIDLLADSLGVIRKKNIHGFDVIDLDSWGSPVKHLDILFKKKYKGIVHCTYCTPMSFTPDKILMDNYFDIDYSMTRRSPALFSKKLAEIILAYLKNNGVNEV